MKEVFLLNIGPGHGLHQDNMIHIDRLLASSEGSLETDRDAGGCGCARAVAEAASALCTTTKNLLRRYQYFFLNTPEQHTDHS